MTPVDLQQRLLADRFRMLTGSKRQRSLRETVGWSYELLNDEERDVLLQASVFSGGFGLDAITAVVGPDDTLDVLDRLDSLVRKSLVTASHATGQVRYGLLETIRQFAEDELAALGALDAVRDRHAAYFAREVVARWDQWHGPGFRDAVDWVTIEFANLRAAFRWSASRGDVETAVDIAAHAAMIGVSTELFETVGWVEEIIDAATVADVRRLPRLYTAAGYSCFTGGPEQGVVRAQTAAAPRDRPAVRPVRAGLGGLHRGARAGLLRSPRRVRGAHREGGRAPRGARAFGVPGSSTACRRPGGSTRPWTSSTKPSPRRARRGTRG